MRNSIWNKKIHPFFSIAAIIIGIFVTTLLVRTGVITISRASPTNVPRQIQITNISSDLATISYVTSDSVTTAVN